MTENQTLTVRDNRTGEEYELPITDGTVRAADFSQIGKTDDEPGLALCTTRRSSTPPRPAAP